MKGKIVPGGLPALLACGSRSHAYGLDYSHRQGDEKGSGYITTADAREIMGAIGTLRA